MGCVVVDEDQIKWDGVMNADHEDYADLNE